MLCPRHSLVLIAHCPSCLEPVPALRQVAERCPYCQRCDYRQAAHVSIPSASLLHQGQALLQHMLMAKGAGGGLIDPPAFVGSPIPAGEPWQYFTLWEQFETLFWNRGASHNSLMRALEKLTLNDAPKATDSPLVMTTGVQTVLFHFPLASWPENLLAMLGLIAAQLKAVLLSLLLNLVANFYRNTSNG